MLKRKEETIALLCHRGLKIIRPMEASGYQFWHEIICERSLVSKLRAGFKLFFILLKAKRKPLVLTDTSHLIGLMAWLNCKLFGIDLIYRARGDALAECEMNGHRLVAWFHKNLFIPKCKKIIVVSQFLKEAFIEQGVAPEKIIVVPTPQPLPETKPYPLERRNRKVLIVTSFRLRDKGLAIKELLGELRAFLSRHREFSVDVFGGGRYLKEVANAVDEREGLSFLGHVNGLEKFYQSSFALLHVSGIDSYPSVINEARSFGTPVIVGDNAGMLEQVEDGVDGIVLKGKGSLIRAIEYLMVKENWERLSREGFKRVQKFHSDEYIGGQLVKALRADE